MVVKPAKDSKTFDLRRTAGRPLVVLAGGATPETRDCIEHLARRRRRNRDRAHGGDRGHDASTPADR